MRRVFVSLLAILYLAAGAGFTLREHYCMGQMVGASIEHSEHESATHRCDRCGMEKKRSDNSCCKDKVRTFKSSPDQTVVKALSFSGALLFAVAPAVHTSRGDAPAPLLAAIPAAPAHGPPLQAGVPRYLRLRSIRI